jgi:hypothetical protein
MALAGEIADGVLLDSVTDPDVVRRARDLVGSGHVAAYTPVAAGTEAGAVAAWVAELGEAGADTVVLQAPGDAPDPAPLVDLLRVSR